MKKLSIQQIDKLANLLYKIKLPIISTTNLYKTAGYFSSNTYSINADELTNLYNFEKINDERSVDFLNNELRVSPVNVDPKIQRILGVEETGKLDANTRKAIEAKKRQLTTDAGGLITDQQLFDHLLNKASLPGRRIF